MRKLRTWVTPITIGSFLLVGCTGVLMFLKVRSGLIDVVHEWLSVIFVIAAALHTWLNWGAVRAYCLSRRGGVIVGGFALLLLLSVLPLGAAPAGHGDVVKKAARTLMQVPIPVVAAVTKRSPEALNEALAQQGLRVTSETLTLDDVAAANHAHPLRVLAAALAGPAGASEGAPGRHAP